MVTLNEIRQIKEERRFEGLSPAGKVVDESRFVLKNLNTGLARMAGIPSTMIDATNYLSEALPNLIFGKRKEPLPNSVPTGREIQKYMSDVGMAYEPGKEPDSVVARTYQNLGAGAPFLPLFGMTAPIIVSEMLSSVGGATGGKALQATVWGQKHPELARALGELSGGLTGGVAGIYATKGGLPGAVIKEGKKDIAPVFNAERRAAKRARSVITEDPEAVRREIARVRSTEEGGLLTPGQASSSTGLARLTRTVEEEVPAAAEKMTAIRAATTKTLEKKFLKSGDINDTRVFLDRKMKQYVEDAEVALSKLDKGTDPVVVSTIVENKLRLALSEARTAESNVWQNLSEDVRVAGANIRSVYKKELNNLTEGGDPGEIVGFIRTKLGRIDKKGNLVGGKLFGVKEAGKSKLVDLHGKPIVSSDVPKPRTADAKAVHQFYSVLGRKIQELSIQRGQTNKIRILKDLRAAALKDLDVADIGDEYKSAIKFSKDLNEKFTKGAIGKVLGFERGDAPTAARALEEIIGTGGQKGLESIQQSLKASPKTKQDIEEFLRSRFVIMAKNEKNNRINVNNGRMFVKKFENILDGLFPKLKTELNDAIAKQTDVDEIAGVSKISDITPLARQRAAAGVFLGADPGEEMAKIINSKNVARTENLTELVQMASKDSTGRALKGLQNGFGNEIINYAKNADETVISGVKILSKLKSFEKAVIRSGLFNKGEYDRFKRIGDAYKRVEMELGAKALKGGVISDLPSKLLSLPLRMLAARTGGKIGKESAGGSLQMAQMLSAESKAFTFGLTNDKAQRLIIAAIFDPKLMDDLLKNAAAMNPNERLKLFENILNKGKSLASGFGRVPVTATAPAAASASESVQLEQRRERLIELLRLRRASK